MVSIWRGHSCLAHGEGGAAPDGVSRAPGLRAPVPNAAPRRRRQPRPCPGPAWPLARPRRHLDHRRRARASRSGFARFPLPFHCRSSRPFPAGRVRSGRCSGMSNHATGRMDHALDHDADGAEEIDRQDSLQDALEQNARLLEGCSRISASRAISSKSVPARSSLSTNSSRRRHQVDPRHRARRRYRPLDVRRLGARRGRAGPQRDRHRAAERSAARPSICASCWRPPDFEKSKHGCRSRSARPSAASRSSPIWRACRIC